MDPQEESSESIPDSEGWDPVPGSTGRQAADSLGEDEDAEGRSESAQMFEEGVNEAEHDQMRQASRADEQSDELEPELALACRGDLSCGHDSDSRDPNLRYESYRVLLASS